jgi:hypothetical protein
MTMTPTFVSHRKLILQLYPCLRNHHLSPRCRSLHSLHKIRKARVPAEVLHLLRALISFGRSDCGGLGSPTLGSGSALDASSESMLPESS